jgi:chromosome segregation ATPase
MKRIVVLLAYLAGACAAEQRQSDPAQSAEIERLRKQVQEKEHLLEVQSRYAEDATRTIVALQEHVAQTEALEDSMGLPDPSGEDQTQPISATRKNQLLARVQRMQLALEEQAKIVADFRQRETQYTVKIGDLEKAISNYEAQIAANRQELAELRGNIQQMRVEVQALRRENAASKQEIAEQQRVIEAQESQVGELQRASRIGFYTSQPLQNLLNSGIVVQRRVMLRRVRTISPDVKREDFEEVNIDERREFEITAPLQKVELVTAHPRTSYQLVQDGPARSRLAVVDPDEFWKLRYLVIATK